MSGFESEVDGGIVKDGPDIWGVVHVLELQQGRGGDGGDPPEVHHAVGAPAEEELVVAGVVLDRPDPVRVARQLLDLHYGVGGWVGGWVGGCVVDGRAWYMDALGGGRTSGYMEKRRTGPASFRESQNLIRRSSPHVTK